MASEYYLKINSVTLFALLNGMALTSTSVAYAKEIDRDYRSARGLAMGNTGVASAEGADSLFYNPAGIANVREIVNEIVLLSPQISIGEDTRSLYKDIKSKKDALTMVQEHTNRPQHAAVQNFSGFIFRRVAFGLLESAQTDLFVGSDPLTGVTTAEAHGIARTGAYFSLAKGFLNESLFIGMTGKFVQKIEVNISANAMNAERQLKGKSSQQLTNEYSRRGMGVGSDLGILWKISNSNEKPVLGLTVRNIGMKYRWTIPDTAKPPSDDIRTVDLGFSVQPGTKKSHTTFALDLKDVFNARKEVIYKRIHAGGEISFQNVLGVLGGLNQGYASYGGFVNLRIVRVEGGIYSEELGVFPGDRKSKRYFGRVSVGWVQ